MSRETLRCVFQVLSLEFFRNGSTFLGLPEGQNMVSLSHGTTVKLSMTCSSPRCPVPSHSLVCSENSLLIIGIGPILNKELNRQLVDG